MVLFEKFRKLKKVFKFYGKEYYFLRYTIYTLGYKYYCCFIKNILVGRGSKQLNILKVSLFYHLTRVAMEKVLELSLHAFRNYLKSTGVNKETFLLIFFNVIF